MKVKQTEQKEIGRIKLSDTQELVASLVDNEKQNLRVWLDTEKYQGPTSHCYLSKKGEVSKTPWEHTPDET